MTTVGNIYKGFFSLPVQPQIRASGVLLALRPSKKQKSWVFIPDETYQGVSKPRLML